MNNPILKYKSNIVLGLLVAVLPFLGFPSEIKTTLFVIFGLLIMVFSYAAERNAEDSYDSKKSLDTEERRDSFQFDNGGEEN